MTAMIRDCRKRAFLANKEREQSVPWSPQRPILAARMAGSVRTIGENVVFRPSTGYFRRRIGR